MGMARRQTVGPGSWASAQGGRQAGRQAGGGGGRTCLDDEGREPDGGSKGVEQVADQQVGDLAPGGEESIAGDGQEDGGKLGQVLHKLQGGGQRMGMSGVLLAPGT